MKYAIIILDGAASRTGSASSGKTALEAAQLPVLDELAGSGRLGTTHTTARGVYPDEATSHLSVLGYAPESCPAGAGPLTALASGLEVHTGEICFCCDLVTVEAEFLRDLTAGGISTVEANPLVEALNAAFEVDGFRFLAGRRNRCLCVWKNDIDPRTIATCAPDELLNEPLRRHMPPGSGSRPLFDLMLKAQELLNEHDVNLVRGDLGENTANSIWLWGQQPLEKLTSFHERFGIGGALIAESRVVLGIGKALGWGSVGKEADSASSEALLTTTGEQAVSALDEHDLVCVQIESPFVLSAGGHIDEKILVLEQIDKLVAKPLFERLRCKQDWRVLVISPRTAPGGGGARIANWTMFMLAGSGIESNRGSAFDEANATLGELHPERAHQLMEYFLRR